MSLDWDITGLKDSSICWVKDDRPSSGEDAGERMHPKTESLIYFTMTGGIFPKTEAQVDAFFRRIQIYEHQFGAFTGHIREVDGKNVKEDEPMTREDIVNHVGLRTNASPVTDTAFKKNILTSVWRELEGWQRNQKRKARAA